MSKRGQTRRRCFWLGIETRFREEHTELVEAFNARTQAKTAQTALLEAVCGEVKAVNEKIDDFCSHTGRLGDGKGDVASIADTVQTREKKADAVSSFVTGLNECLDDITIVFNDTFNEVGKAEEETRLVELKE